jgi:hypothetical protein
MGRSKVANVIRLKKALLEVIELKRKTFMNKVGLFFLSIEYYR